MTFIDFIKAFYNDKNIWIVFGIGAGAGALLISIIALAIGVNV